MTCWPSAPRARSMAAAARFTCCWTQALAAPAVRHSSSLSGVALRKRVVEQLVQHRGREAPRGNEICSVQRPIRVDLSTASSLDGNAQRAALLAPGRLCSDLRASTPQALGDLRASSSATLRRSPAIAPAPQRSGRVDVEPSAALAATLHRVHRPRKYCCCHRDWRHRRPAADSRCRRATRSASTALKIDGTRRRQREAALDAILRRSRPLKPLLRDREVGPPRPNRCGPK